MPSLAVLFKLTGSSCGGKTTLAVAVKESLDPQIELHDFDEVGVPEIPSSTWRVRTTEQWVRAAIDLQGEGRHVLLTGQTPLGELLAVPSAPQLDGIAVCLVDVADGERTTRLAERGSSHPGANLESLINWAAWHRQHAADPRARQQVIVRDDWPEMAWQRWTHWERGDPRWVVETIDTTAVPLKESSEEVLAWVNRQLASWRDGTLPLRPGWEHG